MHACPLACAAAVVGALVVWRLMEKVLAPALRYAEAKQAARRRARDNELLRQIVREEKN